MAVPDSGELSLNKIYNELDDNNYNSGTTNSDVSLTNLSTEGDPPNEDINTDNDAADRPDESAPHAMSEFYSYNHTKGGGCFIAGTQVLMADGSSKNIENVQVDESVKGNISNNTVLELVPAILGGSLLYGFNGDDVFFTPSHPFLTTEGWKSISPTATISEGVEGFETTSSIGQLEINDVISGSSSNVTINSIVSASANSRLSLYNFNVDGDNTYYADNYVVHNKCFVGDTLVTMSDGTYKDIENIVVDDLVFTQNGNEKVHEIFSPIHDNIVELTFSNGNKTKNTDDHPYYVIDKGWCSIKPKLSTELYDVKCEQLKVGDIFIDDEDAQIELLNIMKVNGEFKTYTFSTDSKTYYANKLLVHSEI